MNPTLRNAIPLVFLGLIAVAVVWATSFSQLESADFTFVNDTEVESLDPHKITGAPEGRIADALFEGLYRQMPSKDDPSDLVPSPGVAKSHTLSADQRVYTFHLRDDAYWVNSEGEKVRPVTAHDFWWSWRRTLHPETGSKYAFQLHYIKNADVYNVVALKPGDEVEVEVKKSEDEDREEPFPNGEIVKGKLLEIIKPPEPTYTQGDSLAQTEKRKKEKTEWKDRWIFVVETSAGKVRYSKKSTEENVAPCHQVLLDFSHVGIKVIDDKTLEVTLNNPTSYFLDLCAFYPLYPVMRECLEKHGYPNWTKEGNVVGNGAFLLKSRRIRDRIRMVKNPHYWNAENVQIESVDALAIEPATTMLNLYLSNQVDWITNVPPSVIPDLEKRPDYYKAPMLTTYFYRLNVQTPALVDKRVRQALNMAVDKKEICDGVTRGGQIPARSLVPSMPGYHAPQAGDFNPEKARELLAAAGYPGGRGFPKLQVLYNDNDTHAKIAQVMGSHWEKNLGIRVEFRALEWGSYLAAQHKIQYQISRSAWVADYPDPNTFLDMFVTDGEQNQTHWSNARYDQLIKDAAQEIGPEKRLKMLADAEKILMDELPIIPLYFYVSQNMVKPYVSGFHATAQDQHPLQAIRIDREARKKLREKRGD